MPRAVRRIAGHPAGPGGALPASVALLLLCGCGTGSDAAPERAARAASNDPAGASAGTASSAARSTAPAAAPRGAARAALISTAPVTVRDVTSTFDAIGSIEAEAEVQVVAGIEGIVTSVRFREGDQVTPKTVLATIDPDRYRLLAERARAQHETAVAQEKTAISDLRRREELLVQQPPLVSTEEVERARQEAERLRAATAVAKAASELAEVDRERSIVRPLVSGIVNSRRIEVGQHVESKDPVAAIIDTRRLRLRFKVSETQSVRLHGGMTVSFATSAWPGRSFTATVFHVASGADPATRMVEVLARVADPEGVLKPGFFAEVKAAVETRSDALLVPERAVLATDQGFVVYEIRDGVAHRRVVTLGLRTPDGEVEILNGLERGVTIATDGASLLSDGAPVTVAPGGDAS